MENVHHDLVSHSMHWYKVQCIGMKYLVLKKNQEMILGKDEFEKNIKSLRKHDKFWKKTHQKVQCGKRGQEKYFPFKKKKM